VEARPEPAAPAATAPRRLEEAVARAREAAPRWARAPLSERIAVARSMLAGLHRVAPRLAREGCAAKGLSLDQPSAGDEWLAGAYIALRALRQLAAHLAALARTGNTPVGRMGTADDGRVTERVFPWGALDAAFFPGIHTEVHYLAGVGAREAREGRARFHKAPDHAGRVCAVLGAGNVNSIPVLDVGTKLFNEGKACVLKMNPVNAYVGPILEEAFAEPIARGLLAVVYGGPAEGRELVHHPGVDEVHLTGSNATHDAVVWGPPGPGRAERMARGEPVLRKEITSELGDVSPVLVVPGRWDDRSLRFQAESVAGMVTQNGSFNCLAARMIVLPRGWRLRERFLDLVAASLAAAPARRGWYPGAAEQLRGFVAGREGVRSSPAPDGTLPWTLVTGLDPAADDPAFANETFCPVLVETSVGSEDPLEFLEAAVTFANERLPGTLSAQIVAAGPTLADPATGAAVRRAVRRLEYGSVGVNCSGAYCFGFGTTPWGGFPGQPLHDPRSGRGFVHNTLMLEGVEKSVAWAPVIQLVKPPYFPTHRTLHRLGPRMVALEGGRDWTALPAVVWSGLRG
jgi:acyl-CoA reductase-like NAD-dependent aldehyde dehydrogenase